MAEGGSSWAWGDEPRTVLTVFCYAAVSTAIASNYCEGGHGWKGRTVSMGAVIQTPPGVTKCSSLLALIIFFLLQSG